MPLSPELRSYGLSRSAFHINIFAPFTPDYFMPYVSEVYQLIKGRLGRTKPKLYMLLDSFMMHYRDYETVLKNLRDEKHRTTLWQKLIAEVVKTEEFYKLNRLTAGSTDLSIIASAQFLIRVLGRYGQYLQKSERELQQEIQQTLQQGGQSGQQVSAQAVQQTAQQMVQAILREMREAVASALHAVQEYKEAKEEAENVISIICGSGGHGFSHEALSVWNFLQRPDDFRKRVKLLRELLRYMREFSARVPSTSATAVSPQLYGEIHRADLMRDLRQIQDLHVLEYAYPTELFIIRLLTRTAVVLQRAVGAKPVVFVDKSGSMAEYLSYDCEVPKISVACGFALALYRKFGADIYLFDTEVERVSPREVIKTLLTISADGGTCIEEVLREIERIGKRDYLYIVISDGIDRVDPEYAHQVARKYRVVFCLIPPCWKPPWLKYFKVVRVSKPEDLLKSLRA